MAQYIDKDALVEEIENRIKKYILLQQKPEMSDLQEELQNKIDCLNSIKGYILNTLEVKEVDYEKEIEEHVLSMPMSEFTHESEVEGYWDWAREEFRHFYELGLKAQKGE